MLTIQPIQFSALANEQRKDFLLETVCDWLVLWKTIHRAQPRIGFDQAWRVADFLLGRVENLPQPTDGGAIYTFTHTVLTAAERGAASEQLHRGIDAYCDALPGEDAGLILFESICAPDAVSA
jgi:hypothetical protein